jgi:hypothetical protein
MDLDTLNGNGCAQYTAFYVWLDDGFLLAIAAAQNDLFVFQNMEHPSQKNE